MIKTLIEVGLIVLIYGIFSGMITIPWCFGTSKRELELAIEEENNKLRTKIVKAGEFDVYKFCVKDNAIKSRIKDRMSDGYYDDYMLGTILNVSKAGVENILIDCEDAVRHYSGDGDDVNTEDYIHTEKENKDRAAFYKECVDLCQQRLVELNAQNETIDE